MRRLRTPFLATACALALMSMASVALAQQGGPGGGGPPGGGFGGPPGGGFGGPPGGFGGRGGFGGSSTSPLLTLAEDSAVWDEIKITDEQLGKVTRLRANVNKQSRQMRDALRSQFGTGGPGGGGAPVDPAVRDAQRQQERAARDENDATIREQTDAVLKKVLTGKLSKGLTQFERLQQIDLQVEYNVNGAQIVARPDVAQKLNLGADQLDSIKAVVDQLNQGRDQLNSSRREFFQQNGGFGGRGGRGGGNNNQQQETEADRQARQLQFQQAMANFNAQSTTLKEKTNAQIAKILTAAQKKKFNSLLGAPFNLELLNDGRGPGGGFRGPGGPGGNAGTTTASTATPAATTTTAQAKGATTKGATTKSATATTKSATAR